MNVVLMIKEREYENTSSNIWFECWWCGDICL